MKDRLLAFFDPNRSVPLFIIGTAALTLVLTAAYDLANNPGVWKGGYWLALVSLVVAIIALLVASLRRGSPGRVDLAEEQKPAPHKGLILLAGPTEGADPAAIEYHSPSLAHCWIIATRISRTTALALEQRYQSETLAIYQGTKYVVDEDQIRSTYDLVVKIVSEEASMVGLTTKDIIADITGGLKPMTAGMALACLAQNCEMQYMKTLRDDDGKPLPHSIPEPILIDATFVPTQFG